MIIARGFAIAATLLTLVGQASASEKKYGHGVTDSEIKIGNTSPYSGRHQPSAWWRRPAKPIAKINAEGGINGRNIRFVFCTTTPTAAEKTVEQTRKLVESDMKCFRLQRAGHRDQLRGPEYLNAQKVPQACSSRAGQRKWNVPGKFSMDDGIYPELPE